MICCFIIFQCGLESELKCELKCGPKCIRSSAKKEGMARSVRGEKWRTIEEVGYVIAGRATAERWAIGGLLHFAI